MLTEPANVVILPGSINLIMTNYISLERSKTPK